MLSRLLRTLLLLNISFPFAVYGENTTPAYKQLEGFHYLEIVNGGTAAHTALPMLIGLHYMSGSPETSRDDYADITVPARLLLLAGPYPYRKGYSWFPEDYYELGPDAQADITIKMGERLARFIDAAVSAHATVGRPVVTGYSQGADLTHILALRHPGMISSALPMGGRFADEWIDRSNKALQYPREIHIFHGADDTTVLPSEAFAAAKFYTRNGVSVSLHTYAGVGHGYPAKMKQDYQLIVESLLLNQIKEGK